MSFPKVTSMRSGMPDYLRIRVKWRPVGCVFAVYG